jgi:hypothetical protein
MDIKIIKNVNLINSIVTRDKDLECARNVRNSSFILINTKMDYIKGMRRRMK